MRYVYWSRELAGWGLILIGLWQFWNTYQLLLNKRVIDAAPLGLLALIVFRGGIHLLKVAVAAQAARSLTEQSFTQSRKPNRATARPVGSTQPTSVIPGPRNRASAK